jgi:plastocyanin
MHPYRAAMTLFCVLASSAGACAQQADVALRVQIARTEAHHQPRSAPEIVAWLVPTQPGAQAPAPRPTQQYTLVQKDKMFTPHLLVVPTGSSIEFPNTDPFFHNVFSLFNGKRFDLGLYEAHTHRAVRFDREGVSYIFCNIHPQMGAVVIALSTPFYGISTAEGDIVMRDVPTGSYQLNIWAEDVTKENLTAASRIIEVKPGHDQLDPITLKASGDLMSQHTNKFGESYIPPAKDPY